MSDGDELDNQAPPRPTSLELWERISLALLALFTVAYLSYQVEDRYTAVSDLVAFMVILATGFHLTSGMEAMERTGRMIVAAVGAMFLVRAGTLWYVGSLVPLRGELMRVAIRWGFFTFMVVWTALISRHRPAGQYVYNVIVVATLAMGFGQILTNMVEQGPALMFAASSRALLEGLCLGSAFAYITLGHTAPAAQDGGHP